MKSTKFLFLNVTLVLPLPFYQPPVLPVNLLLNPAEDASPTYPGLENLENVENGRHPVDALVVPPDFPTPALQPVIGVLTDLKSGESFLLPPQFIRGQFCFTTTNWAIMRLYNLCDQTGSPHYLMDQVLTQVKVMPTNLSGKAQGFETIDYFRTLLYCHRYWQCVQLVHPLIFVIR
jgi:hypothetical protein